MEPNSNESSKVLTNGVWAMFSSAAARIVWPVNETGRNSVSPSTTASIIASNRSKLGTTFLRDSRREPIDGRLVLRLLRIQFRESFFKDGSHGTARQS